MSSKHFNKYLQKYNLFFAFAIMLFLVYACNATKKVPKGEYLLTKNTFEYTDGNLFADKIPGLVKQKPNSKDLWIIPTRLYLYNFSNIKYDSILAEYFTFPREMRTQKLRDSLFIKNKHPEFVGKKIFFDGLFHSWGKPPVILQQANTETSANSIRQFLVYKGYWDASVKYKHHLDSANKKAQANYSIKRKDPTFVSEYFYKITDENIKRIYEQNINKSLMKTGDILDQENLEKEAKRITDLMHENGYYTFNRSNEEIFFTADTLKSRKKVPLTAEIKKDSLDSKYKVATYGNISVAVVENQKNIKTADSTCYNKISFFKLDDQYKTRALWLPILLKPGGIYDQKNLDNTKRNIISMNNFSILKAKDSLRQNGLNSPNDSIIDVQYILKPLPKYETKWALDGHYSQILNYGFSPSTELITRNIFGGAENLSTSISGIIGTTKNAKNPDHIFNAYEISAQVGLSFPRLLLPFKYWKIIPKKYSPTSNINISASIQNNIGMDKINLNTSLNYFANVNDIVSHRLSLFNTQFSFTQNKENYYTIYTNDATLRDGIFDDYFIIHPEIKALYPNALSSDDVSNIILTDQDYANTLSTDQKDKMILFFQSLLNKDRLTQDIFIGSMIYNFIYNEIGKKEQRNPFYLNGKIEFAGNLLGALTKREEKNGVVTDANVKTVFQIPYSQFVKIDFDIRKYFSFFNDKHTLVLRQLIGVGIPYGNSTNMPYVRSYFNGGSNDIRAWVAFSGLGPADSQIDQRIRTYIMDNVKLTTNIEYRFPFNQMFEGALFTDVGNIWSLKDNGIGDQFKFNKFISQMGIGSGFGIRVNFAYIIARIDFAYKIHDPNQKIGERWRFSQIKPLQPTWNIAIGYPF